MSTQPVYFVLGIDVIDHDAVVLGFNPDRAEAERVGRERADKIRRGMPVAVFQLTERPSQELGEEMRRWFEANGQSPDDARDLVKRVARSIHQNLYGRRPGERN